MIITKTVLECDRCHTTQIKDERIYWKDLISTVNLDIPADGINNGVIKAELCRSCRSKLHDYILSFLDQIEGSF